VMHWFSSARAMAPIRTRPNTPPQRSVQLGTSKDLDGRVLQDPRASKGNSQSLADQGCRIRPRSVVVRNTMEQAAAPPCGTAMAPILRARSGFMIVCPAPRQ